MKNLCYLLIAQGGSYSVCGNGNKFWGKHGRAQDCWGKTLYANYIDWPCDAMLLISRLSCSYVFQQTNTASLCVYYITGWTTVNGDTASHYCGSLAWLSDIFLCTVWVQTVID